jgi:predicted DNA-binding transcriptional regulator YafY
MSKGFCVAETSFFGKKRALNAHYTDTLLIAWCEKRKDFRNFRLDRMKDLKIPAPCFRDEKGKTLQAYLDQDWD